MNTEGLIAHQTVSAIVENVDLARHDIDQAFKLLQGAKERLRAVLGDGTNCYDSLFPRHIDDYNLASAAQSVQAHVARNAWRYVLRQTGITQYMTEKRQQELQDQLEKGQFPMLTVENVMSTLQGLSGQLSTLLLESIKEVFDWLRPWHPQHKTNKQFSVPYKVIIVNAVASHWAGEMHLNYYREANFRSLGNVMSLLDGHGIQQYPHDLVTQLREALKPAPWGEWTGIPYMRVKPYGNGNLHVQFVRKDLVDRLNQLGSDGTVSTGEAA